MPTRYRHIVTKLDVAINRQMGTPVTALCGHFWTPDPDRETRHDPLCPACQAHANRVGLPLGDADKPFDGPG